MSGNRVVFGPAAVAILAIACAWSSAASAIGGNTNAMQAVPDLIYCYARGTDQIGDATTNADPLAAGIAV